MYFRSAILIFIFLITCLQNASAAPAIHLPELGLTMPALPEGWRAQHSDSLSNSGFGKEVYSAQKASGTMPLAGLTVRVETKPESEWKKVDIRADAERACSDKSMKRVEMKRPPLMHSSVHSCVLKADTSFPSGFSLSMYTYQYWHPPHVVTIVGMSFRPEADKDLEQVLDSVKIESNTPITGVRRQSDF